jgi:hypothetical protein
MLYGTTRKEWLFGENYKYFNISANFTGILVSKHPLKWMIQLQTNL